MHGSNRKEWSHYIAKIDAEGRLAKMYTLPWSGANGAYRSKTCYYNAANQLIKYVDSMFMLNAQFEEHGSIQEYVFDYDTISNKLGKNLNYSVRGKDFWWFLKQALSFDDWDAFYVSINQQSGDFKKKISSKSTWYFNGVVVDTLSFTIDITNIDNRKDRVLTSELFKAGIKINTIKYYYQSK